MTCATETIANDLAVKNRQLEILSRALRERDAALEAAGGRILHCTKVERMLLDAFDIIQHLEQENAALRQQNNGSVSTDPLMA